MAGAATTGNVSIKSADWHNGMLHIMLTNGERREFHGVPQEIYAEFRRSPDHVWFYVHYIRDHYTRVA